MAPGARRRTAAVFVLAALAAANGCGGKSSHGSEPTPSGGPAESVAGDGGTAAPGGGTGGSGGSGGSLGGGAGTEPSYASAGEDGSFDPLHPECCADDEYCGKHARCINHGCTYDNPTGCWLDEQCAPDELCSGAFLCECAVICHSRTQVGTCVPRDAGCCRANDDCPDASPCLKGRCMAGRPSEERCWSDRDCVSDRGGRCENPTVCPCGKECDEPDEPGHCTYPI